MSAIADLEALGYTCGIAHGDVATEEAALAAAQAAADPQAVIEKVNQMTADTVQTLANIGKLPDDPAERLDLASKIGAAALELLTGHVDAQVDFHERALAIAKEMPDVWHIDGPGFSGYVACKDDGTGWDDANQELLDALADPGSHSERVWQNDNADAMAAASQLQACGYAVERPTLGADSFTVDGGKPLTGAQLSTFAKTAARKPSFADQVADAILADPGIAAATKKAIQIALNGNTG